MYSFTCHYSVAPLQLESPSYLQKIMHQSKCWCCLKDAKWLLALTETFKTIMMNPLLLYQDINWRQQIAWWYVDSRWWKNNLSEKDIEQHVHPTESLGRYWLELFLHVVNALGIRAQKYRLPNVKTLRDPPRRTDAHCYTLC